MKTQKVILSGIALSALFISSCATTQPEPKSCAEVPKVVQIAPDNASFACHIDQTPKEFLIDKQRISLSG